MKLRILSLGFLVAAFAALFLDALHGSQNDPGLTATGLGDLWAREYPASYESVLAIFLRYLPALVWDPGFKTLLRLPVWFLLGLAGIALRLIGRLRPANDPSTATSVGAPLSIGIRSLGIAVKTVTLAVMIYDLWRGGATQANFVFTTVGNLWQGGHPESFGQMQELVQARAPGIWNPGLLTLFRTPAWLLVALLGLMFYRFGLRWARHAEIDGRTDQSGKPTEQLNIAVPDISPRSELATALKSCQSAFLSIGFFSGIINMLMLTGAFFMLEIYDRVLPSRSVPTLIALAVLVFVLFSAYGILDLIRGRILARIGAALDQRLSTRVYDVVVRLPLRTAGRGDGLEPLRDLDTIRAFLSGSGPTVFFDLPWLPVYLIVIFAFHPIIGWTALIGATILIVLTLVSGVLTRQPMRATSSFALSRNGIAETSRRNAEVLVAMGMAGRMAARWGGANQNYLSSQQQVSDVAGGFGSISKSLRMMLQSAVLGVGAYFVIIQEATAGIIIAGAILVGRALAPVDLAIANWKSFVAARQGWRRLTKLLAEIPAQVAAMELPPPGASLKVESVSACPPSKNKLVVNGISFTLKAGQGLGIIGPSASGKSSLVRLLVGVWPAVQGRVRLDGAELDQWSEETLGRHIGYMPQDVELFAGTVAENICRFQPDAAAKTIIAAARAAGTHDLIVGLPQGYETEIGDQGEALSAGQRQRVALARALYEDPFLVVLDEPNSNLDSEGEAALTQAILEVRERKGIIVVVAHRASALAGADLVLAMHKGKAVAFGPRDEVLSKVLRPVSKSKSGSLKVVSKGKGKVVSKGKGPK